MKNYIKNIVIVFCSVFIFSNLYANLLTDSPEIIKNPKNYLVDHPELIKSSLFNVLKIRCSHYLSSEENQCPKGIKTFLESLDMSILRIENQDCVVSFTSELSEVYSRKDLEVYLQKLYKILISKDVYSFDLGSFTLNFFKDAQLSIKVMAVLFQDIFPKGSPSHLFYLKSKFGLSKKLELLLKVNNKLNHFIASEKDFKIFNVAMLNTKIYHFLVPNYLALKMSGKHLSTKMSFFLPFIFNYLYELSDFKMAFLYSVAEPYVITQESKLEDIRMGELGALFFYSTQELTSFELFKGDMERSPHDYIESILKQIK